MDIERVFLPAVPDRPFNCCSCGEFMLNPDEGVVTFSLHDTTHRWMNPCYVTFSFLSDVAA